MNETTLPRQYQRSRYATTQYVAQQPNHDSGYSFSFSPMAALHTFSVILVLASGALMTQSEEWRVLTVLAFSSSVGGLFGLCYTALSKSGGKMPWQIRLFRFAANLTGGIGIGSLAVLAEVKWLDWNPGPLLIFGTGFLCSAMSVMIFRTLEPIVIRRLQALGHLEVPNPPAREIDLTAWQQREYREPPTVSTRKIS